MDDGTHVWWWYWHAYRTWVPYRSLYTKRIAHDLDAKAADHALLDARARFVAMAVRGDLPELFRRAPRREVTDALRAAGFAPRVASAADGDGGGGGDDAEVVAPAADGDGAGDYEHLLRMPLLALTDERAAKLERQRDEKQAEMAELRNTSELQLWKRELDALRPRLQEYLEAEAE